MATEFLNIKIAADGRSAGVAFKDVAKAALSLIGVQKMAEAAFRTFQATLGRITPAALVRETLALAGSLAEVAKRARAIGFEVEQLDVAEGVIGLMTDGTVDATRAMQDFQRSIAEARDGTESQAKAMQKLGIATAEFDGLTLVEQMGLVSDRFSNLTDDAEATQVAMDLFGRSGRQIIAVLRQGGDTLRSAEEGVRATGVVTGEAAAQAEVLDDSIFLLNRSLLALKREALVPLMPILAGTSDFLADFAQGMRDAGGDAEALGPRVRRVFLEGILPAVFATGQTTVEVFRRMGIGFKFWEIQGKSALLGVQGTIDIYAAAALRMVGANEQADEVMGRVEDQAWALRRAELELEDMQFALAHGTAQSVAAFEALLASIRDASARAIPDARRDFGDLGLAAEDAAEKAAKAGKAIADAVLAQRLLAGGIDAASILRETAAAQAELTAAFDPERLEQWAGEFERIGKMGAELVERFDPVVPAIDAQAEAWRRAQEEAAAYTTTLDYVQQGLGAVGDFARAIGDIVVAQHQRGSEAAKEAARSAFVVQQLVALAQATISMFVAIAQANASAPYPANVPAIVAAGVTGGIQIAGIAATTIAGVADAGLTPEQINRAVTGSHSTVVVQRGEAVIDRRGTSEISAMLGLQRERMAGGGGQSRVVIDSPVLLDGRQVGRFVDDHLVDTTERGRSYSTRVQPGTA